MKDSITVDGVTYYKKDFWQSVVKTIGDLVGFPTHGTSYGDLPKLVKEKLIDKNPISSIEFSSPVALGGSPDHRVWFHCEATAHVQLRVALPDVKILFINGVKYVKSA